jgi:hypothetical protein
MDRAKATVGLDSTSSPYVSNASTTSGALRKYGDSVSSCSKRAPSATARRTPASTMRRCSTGSSCHAHCTAPNPQHRPCRCARRPQRRGPRFLTTDHDELAQLIPSDTSPQTD